MCSYMYTHVDSSHCCLWLHAVTAFLCFSGDHKQKYYWGHKEILIPVYKKMEDAFTKHSDADVLVNFASLRSAYDSTRQALLSPQVGHTGAAQPAGGSHRCCSAPRWVTQGLFSPQVGHTGAVQPPGGSHRCCSAPRCVKQVLFSPQVRHTGAVQPPVVSYS